MPPSAFLGAERERRAAWPHAGGTRSSSGWRRVASGGRRRVRQVASGSAVWVASGSAGWVASGAAGWVASGVGWAGRSSAPSRSSRADRTGRDGCRLPVEPQRRQLARDRLADGDAGVVGPDRVDPAAAWRGLLEGGRAVLVEQEAGGQLGR